MERSRPKPDDPEGEVPQGPVETDLPDVTRQFDLPLPFPVDVLDELLSQRLKIVMPDLQIKLPVNPLLRSELWLDFGVELRRIPDMFASWTNDLLAPMQNQVLQLQAALSTIADDLRSLVPPNWPEDHDVRLERLMELSSDWGIPLVWIPRAEVIVHLAEAEDPVSALQGKAPEILDDCRRAVAESDAQPLEGVARMMTEVIDSLENGRYLVAQAGAAIAYENLWRREHLYQDSLHFRSVYESIRDRPKDAPMAQMRGAFIAMAASIGWQRFRPENGDAIPDRFNRHGSVHALSPIQYHESNALLAAMLATALLRETHEINDTR